MQRLNGEEVLTVSILLEPPPAPTDRDSADVYGLISDPRVGVAATHESAAAAMCVRLVDVSGILAIHIPTRSLLRSSSTHEPSDPPLRVVFTRTDHSVATSAVSASQDHIGKP